MWHIQGLKSGTSSITFTSKFWQLWKWGHQKDRCILKFESYWSLSQLINLTKEPDSKYLRLCGSRGKLRISCRHLYNNLKCNHLLWVVSCPPPFPAKTCWCPNFQYLQMWPCLKESPHRGNEVKMRSLVWALIPRDGCLYKKGKLDTERNT